MPEEPPEDVPAPEEAPEPDAGEAEAAPPPPPVAKAFLCAYCHKGKLDPTGKKPGDEVACPSCGRKTKVTLEHTLGEAHASRREQLRAKAHKSFGELSDEEQLEELQKSSGPQKVYYFLHYHLGPKGMVAMYLGIVILTAGAFFAYLVVVKGVGIKKMLWYHWLIPIGGAVAGVLGWLGHATFLYYWKKHKAAAAAADPRRGSGRRRQISTRVKPPAPAKPE